MHRSFETLTRIIEVLADPGSDKLVVVHHNGDPDALGSALALQAVFPNIEIGAPLGLSVPARHLLEHVGGRVLEKPRFDDFEYIILVDTSSRVQLGEFSKHIKEPIILDHHAYHDDWDDALYLYVDPNKAACCELIYELLQAAAEEDYIDFSLSGASGDVERLEKVGLALMTGIWTDTAGFRHATPRTLQIAADLLSQTGTSIADVLGILEQEQEFHDGRKDANLKALQRLEFQRVGRLTVATSHISAYEASAAKALTLAGADVAFCVAEKGDEVRASGRARRKAVQDHGVHLGHLFNRVGKELGMMGGGHDGAAGMNLPKKEAGARGVAVPDRETILNALVKGLDADLRASKERAAAPDAAETGPGDA